MRLKIENLGYIKNVDLDLSSRITLIQGEDTFRGKLISRTLKYLTDGYGFWSYNFDGLYTEDYEYNLEITSDNWTLTSHRWGTSGNRSYRTVDIIELEDLPQEVSSGFVWMAVEEIVRALFHPVDEYLTEIEDKKDRIKVVIDNIDQFDYITQKSIIERSIRLLYNNNIDIVILSNSFYVKSLVEEYAKERSLKEKEREKFLSVYEVRSGISNLSEMNREERSPGVVGKYVKKPVEIEAIKLSKDNQEEVHNFVGKSLTFTKYGAVINTLEGDMSCSFGDYIIKGVRGEFYPCKKEIFEETYS